MKVLGPQTSEFVPTKKPRRVKSTAKKGSANEHLVIQRLERAGALLVMRGAASKCHGLTPAKIDLFAAFPDFQAYVQVKTNRWTAPEDRDELARFHNSLRLTGRNAVCEVRIDDGGSHRPKTVRVRMLAECEYDVTRTLKTVEEVDVDFKPFLEVK